MIERRELQKYLNRVLDYPVTVLGYRPLERPGRESDPKAFGYGGPLEVECLVQGEPKAFVLTRQRLEEGFGHDYPADRAWAALWGHAAYNSLPRHVRSLDVGFIQQDGKLVSAGGALEFFQVVEKADGTPYWMDLDRLRSESLTPLDRDRVDVLARSLAALHADKRSAPSLYQRRTRELVGHGECLMGILDSYPHPYPVLPPERCEALERAAVTWRWRLRGRSHRLARVHGDFHPWNILFREGTDFSLLDRSRGEWGEPADDVAALAINYLFFGLIKGPGLAEPFRGLFRRFFATYLAASGDAEVFEVLPPYFMWRALVVAHPRWYPAIPESVRVALLAFAGRMAVPGSLDLEDVERSLERKPLAVGSRAA
jgi:hypothetical protein